MEFQAIAGQAQEQNGWQVRAIVYTEPTRGVVLFEHHLDAEGEFHGTAEFLIEEGSRVGFHTGTYDMSARIAVNDFGRRAYERDRWGGQ